MREAKSAAALNHPNIATIHEVGESEGTNFIAMEFVDGETLRDKIHKQETELRKLLRWLQHAAESLARAHEEKTNIITIYTSMVSVIEGKPK